MLKAAKKRVFSRLFHFASVFIYRAMKCQDMKNASPPCFGNYFSIVCVCTVDCIKMRFYYIASDKKNIGFIITGTPPLTRVLEILGNRVSRKPRC